MGRQRMSFDSLLDSDIQLNQKSYYEASVQRDPASAPLQGEGRADGLVVGAGFAGLASAIEVAPRGDRGAPRGGGRGGHGGEMGARPSSAMPAAWRRVSSSWARMVRGVPGTCRWKRWI